METYRMSYKIEGQKERKTVEWPTELDDATMSTFAKWVMSQEFPGKSYRTDKGMEAVLKEHGITEIRSPDLTSECFRRTEET